MDGKKFIIQTVRRLLRLIRNPLLSFVTHPHGPVITWVSCPHSESLGGEYHLLGPSEKAETHRVPTCVAEHASLAHKAEGPLKWAMKTAHK